MAEAKKIAGRRRLRYVRLRPETTTGGQIDAMADYLGSLLRISRARARGLLLRMRLPKRAA